MTNIVLEGIHLKAPLGLTPEQRLIGQELSVNVSVEINAEKAQQDDSLYSTLNYETLHLLVRNHLQKEANLLETLCASWLKAVKELFPEINRAEISVQSLHPIWQPSPRCVFVRMDTNKQCFIGIKDFRMNCRHGFYEEEYEWGNIFELDIVLKVPYPSSDELSETVNLETLFLVCKKEMAIPAKLLEHVAGRIVEACKGMFPTMQALQVHFSKLNPPLKGIVDRSMVKIEQKYSTNCPRCKKPMLCNNSKECWCNGYLLSAAAKEMLAQKYTGCLCESCIKEYALKN